MVKRCLVVWFFCFVLFLNLCVYKDFTCIYVCVPHALLVSSGVGCQSEEDISPPELELGVVVSTHMCWELNPGPLQEPQVLFSPALFFCFGLLLFLLFVCLMVMNSMPLTGWQTNIYSLNCIVSHYFIYVYLSVCLYVAGMQVPAEPEESVGSLGVTGVYEMPDMVAEIWTGFFRNQFTCSVSPVLSHNFKSKIKEAVLIWVHIPDILATHVSLKLK